MENTEQVSITHLLRDRQYGMVRSLLLHMTVPDIADLILDLDRRDRALAFRLLPKLTAAEVFAELDPTYQNMLLTDLTDEETKQLLVNMRPDDRTELLEEMPGRVTQKLLNLLDPDSLSETRHLLGYPEESVGRLMTPDYVAVRPYWTLGRAIEHIRTVGSDSETVSVIYVVDDSWHLIDALELQRFVLGSPSDAVEQIMDYRFVSMPAYEDREEAVRLMQRHDLFSLPVIDSEGVLLGVVTADDVLDVAQQEATEDFQKAAAVAPLDTGYRESSPWSLYKKRIGWLVALVLVSLMSSGVIAAYEQTLASAIALAFFIPLLIASGGNAGAQAATLMVRALATGDVRLQEWVWTIVRELGVGIALGITMGIAAWILGIFRGGLEIALVVAATMTAIVVVANLIGVTLPFLLTRIGLDPAVASSPLITTLADATGLLIYFSIAARILGV